MHCQSIKAELLRHYVGIGNLEGNCPMRYIKIIKAKPWTYYKEVLIASA